MKELLIDIRKKLASGVFQCEEHIRLSLVARILLALGWDVWNPQEVFCEYKPVENEDNTRVDIALFQNHYEPTAFIEIKQHGMLAARIAQVEKQLRDYCRDNTAIFSIATDGQIWRFYYSQTGGEFANKCYKILDVMNDDLESLVQSFQLFLSKESVDSGKAKREAEEYLQLTKKQRAIEDAIPSGRTMTTSPPYPRLPEAIVIILNDRGFDVTVEEVELFLHDNDQELLKPKPDRTKNPIQEDKQQVNDVKKNDLSFIKRKPKKLYVIDSWYEVSTWAEVKAVTYSKLIDKLVNAKLPKSLKVSMDPSEFPTNRMEIGNTGYFIDINYGSEKLVGQCKKAMQYAGYDPSKDWSFELR